MANEVHTTAVTMKCQHMRANTCNHLTLLATAQFSFNFLPGEGCSGF